MCGSSPQVRDMQTFKCLFGKKKKVLYIAPNACLSETTIDNLFDIYIIVWFKSVFMAYMNTYLKKKCEFDWVDEMTSFILLINM